MSQFANVRAVTALITGLLALTVAAHVWAASTPLPFGGPNVVIAALTVAATAAYVAWRRNFTVERLTLLALAVAFCLLLWAAVSVWINDQYPSHLTRLGQTTMGIAMLWAVSVAVITLPRIRIVTAAIVAATFVSALVGLGILVQGEPFLSLWLWIADVSEGRVESAMSGRTAGLSVGTITFAYQLAVAIPLAVGLLLLLPLRLFPLGRSGERGDASIPCKILSDEWIWRGAIVVLLTVLTTALVLNASRSALLGVFFGGMVALAPLLLKRPGLRRTPNLLSLAIVAVATFALVSLIEEGGAFNSLFEEGGAFNRRVLSVQDTSARARLPMVITALRYAVEYPLGTVVYEPEPRHLPHDLDPAVQREVLRHTPHNQFLVVLVYYGWPGLALLMLFYGVIAVALLSSIRLALKLSTADAIVLVASLAGCIAAYGCNSLFHNAGPFVGDWYHWIVIGLVFSAHAVLKRETAAQHRL